MTATLELKKLTYIRQIATPFILKATRVDPVPWIAAAGPSTWTAFGQPAIPVFVLELDTRLVSAGKLVKDKTLLHDISTALGGRFQVSWVNSIGLALVVDERPPRQLDLVKALAGSECAMIVGPRGTGKTTLLQHIISQRGDLVMVFDPKVQTPNKWLDSLVIGAQGNYEAMAKELQEIVYRMEHGGYDERVLVVIDELWLILKSMPALAGDIWKIVTLGREPRVDIIVGTHSEMVRGLGIEGEGDLRDSFDVVRLRAGFEATFTPAGGEEQPATHPGKFERPHRLPTLNYLRDEEIALVEWAVYRNSGSFSLGKMKEASAVVGLLPYEIRKLAEAWEQKKWLTPAYRDKSGQIVGRRVTPELMALAKINIP
jgi:hypothetical protein